jgi:hypothetical protein
MRHLLSLTAVLFATMTVCSACAPVPGQPQPNAARPGVASPAPVTRTVLIRIGDRKVMPAPASPISPMTQPVAVVPPPPAPATLPATQPAVAATQPAEFPENPKARDAFIELSKYLERKGTYKTPDVYVVTVPRDDWTIMIEGMEVPTAAGLESVFQFYFCSCGKTNVIGQFCVQDYEANDVIDALRAARIEIASVAPMLLHTRQSPVIIRFFAESYPEPLGKGIREALRWTGKERMPAVGPRAREKDEAKDAHEHDESKPKEPPAK